MKKQYTPFFQERNKNVTPYTFLSKNDSFSRKIFHFFLDFLQKKYTDFKERNKSVTKNVTLSRG